MLKNPGLQYHFVPLKNLLCSPSSAFEYLRFTIYEKLVNFNTCRCTKVDEVNHALIANK